MSRTSPDHHPDIRTSPVVAVTGHDAAELPAPGSQRGIRIYLLHVLSVSLFFGGGFLITLAWPLVRWIFGERRCSEHGPTVLQYLFRVFQRIVHRLGLFRVTWRDAGQIHEVRGKIIVANHPGLLDAVFLIAEIPRAVCVMQAKLIRNPAFYGAARLAGYICNDQGSEMIRACVRKLEAGDNLVIFPEGTRTRLNHGPLNPFKAGFALAAVRSHAEVQTIIIDQSQPYLTQGLRVLTPESAPVGIDISMGAAFSPEHGESAREFATRVEGYFRETLSHPGRFRKGTQ